MFPEYTDMFLHYIEANALNSIPQKNGLTSRPCDLPTFAQGWKSSLKLLQIEAVVPLSRPPWHLPGDTHPAVQCRRG
jgi:hypothetical protein